MTTKCIDTRKFVLRAAITVHVKVVYFSVQTSTAKICAEIRDWFTAIAVKHVKT
jgi:hypothetical protein